MMPSIAAFVADQEPPTPAGPWILVGNTAMMRRADEGSTWPTS
jgi:hypothetical protein